MKKIINLLLTSIMAITLSSASLSVHAFENSNNSKGENDEDYKIYSHDEIDIMIDDIASATAAHEYGEELRNVESVYLQKEEISRQLQETLDTQSKSRVPTYDSYRTEAATIKYANIEGKASSQPLTGYTRKKGDMLFWNPNNGTTISIGVSFGYKNVSVSGTLGVGGINSVGSGFVCPTNGIFYVYAHKVYKVSNPNLYGHPYNSPAGTWVRIDSASTTSYYGDKTHLREY